ncbi:MAG: topoisomerase IV, partial [Clostridia bacterium]|nr:topoisomerase IV [Clostridia bacterium]
KLLYTMYKMGLLTGSRTKSANIVGQTMRLNPHVDAAIYETMVRLARGNESLLHPLVDSKGNFGKVYSRYMAYAASRYTEAKLDPICAELFRDIDEDTVDFVDNYDGTLKEPTLLPTTFPNILLSPNTGIAVGMASNICSFNLRELCETTIALIRDPDHDILSTLKAPDFPTGGYLVYDKKALSEIYETGKGSFRLRAKWKYDKKQSLIEITEIPYTTTVEAVKDKIVELFKAGKLKEINDVRDETDKSGLKLTIDLKRSADPDKVMAYLISTTPLEESFPANFNVLIASTPRIMGVREILTEWTSWRSECVARRVYFNLERMKERRHLLKGLEKILLDIDKAIKIIRETDEEADVIPNLMIGFRIDEVQANYIADIRLRNINREYILKRTSELEELEKSIAEAEGILKDRKKIKKIIVKELEEVAKKYGKDRMTEILYEDTMEKTDFVREVPEYPCTLFLSRSGYFKKITPQSLRMSGEQKFKEGDSLLSSFEANNKDELLIFSDKAQVYKTAVSSFEDSKASLLGDFLPQTLGMDPGETSFAMVNPLDYKGFLLFVFENGKVARVDLEAYQTKTNRRRLTGAYSAKSPLIAVIPLTGEAEVVLYSAAGRALSIKSSLLSSKPTRDNQGVQVMKLKKGDKISAARLLSESPIKEPGRYRSRALPAAGAVLKPQDAGDPSLLGD